jgi:hypothetical protein
MAHIGRNIMTRGVNIRATYASKRARRSVPSDFHRTDTGDYFGNLPKMVS